MLCVLNCVAPYAAYGVKCPVSVWHMTTIDPKKQDRVNVAVPRRLHEEAAKLARQLGRESLQECVIEAVAEWLVRNRPEARRELDRARNELLAAF